VRKSVSAWWFDEYVGTAEALAATGLVSTEQLPGKPGMRKVVVTIYQGGTIPTGPTNLSISSRRDPGCKWIKRASKTTYRVCVAIGKEEQAKRKERDEIEDREYDLRMKALPRPAPLVRQLSEQSEHAVQECRANMCLVWSRPLPSMTWQLPA
jgi:hypothetical protein